MKNIVIAFFLLTTFVFANESVAIVKFIKGDVKVKNKQSIQVLKTGQSLKVKDIIITGSKSQVGIIFNDGSSLTLDSNSYITIENFIFNPLEEKYDFKLYLEKGKTIFKSGKIGKLAPKSFKMRIPQGTIGIRGTKFLVEAQ